MGEFVPITSQEQLDAVIGDRLKRSEEKWQKKYEGYLSSDDVAKKTADLNRKVDDLSNALNAEKEKNIGFTKELDEKNAMIKDYQVKDMKINIAQSLGMDSKSIEFFKGDDEESITKSAESLKSLFGRNNIAPANNNEQPIDRADEKKKSYASMVKNLV